MSEEIHRLRIPASLRKEVSPLLDQQFWLFGCDVRNTSGNLLLELGFERTRPPEGWKAATQYHIRFSDGLLKLWGFGFWYTQLDNSTGILLRRSEFAPRLCPLFEPIWRTEDLPVANLPSTPEQISYVWQSLNKVFNWFAEYEKFILQRCGIEYRRHCLLQWTKQRIGHPEDLSERWQNIANICQGLSVEFHVHPVFYNTEKM
jgi:hypothetical protein